MHLISAAWNGMDPGMSSMCYIVPYCAPAFLYQPYLSNGRGEL